MGSSAKKEREFRKNIHLHHRLSTSLISIIDSEQEIIKGESGIAMNIGNSGMGG